MKLFKMPQVLPPDVPMETRLEIVRSIGDRAAETFNLKYPEIAKWFDEYDSLYLLSYCAFYFLAYPEGIDREAIGELTFYHHYIEIMQAFALARERNISAKPLLNRAQQLEDDMREIGEALQLRNLSIPKELTSEEEMRAYHLRTEMMGYTTAIRNWAYPHQMKRITLRLAATIQDQFNSIHGMNPVDFMKLLFDLSDETEELLNAHRARVMGCLRAKNHLDMIEAYNVAFPENVQITGSQVDEIWTHVGKNKKALRSMLIAHADIKLDKIYSFTLERASEKLRTATDAAVLEALFDRLSYKFGDLKDFEKDHIVLGNPVLEKPFIQVEKGLYFSAVWGILPHLAMDLFEGLIWSNDSMRETYTNAKANFLENETERIFREAFPHADVHRGSLWSDVESGKQYENDLLVIQDSFAIVVEAKSGTVSAAARRGAPKRLFETLRELIEEPSEQALRFIAHLEKNKEAHSFRTKRGAINMVDSRHIKYFIPLGVTLSHLGAIGSNLKKLISAQVVEKKLEELAPSISYTDLEAIFELLPLEVEKIHYLARRREFEGHMDYEGDELDLLGFYLDNGFNIGEVEYSKDMGLNLLMKSKELDPYFVGVRGGKEVTKPELSMSRWWRDLLLAITDRKTEGWIETGFILLNSTKEDQEKFENMFKTLMRRVKNGEVDKEHNWLMFASGPERRRYLIAGYPYLTLDKSVRDGVMGEIISDENFKGARGCVVIGIQMHNLDYPYSVLARRAATNLLDALTLN